MNLSLLHQWPLNSNQPTHNRFSLGKDRSTSVFTTSVGGVLVLLLCTEGELYNRSTARLSKVAARVPNDDTGISEKIWWLHQSSFGEAFFGLNGAIHICVPHRASLCREIIGGSPGRIYR